MNKIATIQNVVSTAEIGTKINLSDLSRNTINVEYNPSKFIAAILRIRNPRTTCLCFPTGRLVITGAKSVEESKKAARKFARRIQCAITSSPIKFLNFTIRNIVASLDVKNKIDLYSLYYSNMGKCTYAQEDFPGLKYKPYNDENVLAIIFNSGRVIITGAQNLAKINEFAELIYRLLLKFRK